MTQTLELPWGNETLLLPLSPSWRLEGILLPPSLPSLPVVADACAQALEAPIGAAPLSSRTLAGKHVVLVVDDHSRPTPVADFILPVLQHLEAAGVTEDQIEILIACGTHRPTTLEEATTKLGVDVINRIAWTPHSAYERDNLEKVGTTTRGTPVFLNRRLLTADLVVTLGSIEPHILVGFGGGAKMIIPGVAGVDTIAHNHLQGLEHGHFDYVGSAAEDSPMRLDMEEGVALARKEIFMVSAILDSALRPVRFFCGDPVLAHRAGEAAARELSRIVIPHQADVVITHSFPMDLDIRQGLKCLGNTLFACREGGTMVGLLRCERGVGEMPLQKIPPPYAPLRLLMSALGDRRILPFVKQVKRKSPAEELFLSHFGLQMLRRNHLALYSDSPLLPNNFGLKVGIAKSFNQAPPLIDWVSAKVPPQASVWVFPCGGSTYAELAP